MSDNKSNNNVEMKREYAVDEYGQQYVLFPEEVNFDNVVVVNAKEKTYDNGNKTYNGADLLYKYPKYDEGELVEDEYVYDYMRVYMPDNEDSKGNAKGLFANKGIIMMGDGDSKKPTIQLFLTNKNKDTQKSEESEDQKVFNDFLNDMDKIIFEKCEGNDVIEIEPKTDPIKLIYVPYDKKTKKYSDNKILYINIGYMKEYKNDKGDVRAAEVTAFIRDAPKYKKMYNKRVKELGKELQGKERNEKLAEVADEVSQQCKLTVKNIKNYEGKRFAFKKGIVRFYGIYQSGKKLSILKNITQGEIDYIELGGSQNKFQRKRTRTGKFLKKLVIQNNTQSKDVKEDKGEEIDML